VDIKPTDFGAPGGVAKTLLVGGSGTVSDCSARNNAVGIISGYGSTVSGCTASYNTGEGIVGTGSTISGCTVLLNTGDGIRVTYDSQLTGNTCRYNGLRPGDGAGIRVMAGGNRIESNNLAGNDRGIEVGGADNYVAGNIVKGNTDNYDIAAGNQLNILLCEVPENIDWPASVKFAGTLICSSTTTNGITVNADDVTIDMDGHALVGPGTNSHHGIYQATTRRNLRVHNGKVVEWGGIHKAGVRACGKNNQFDHIQAATNDEGIFAGTGSTISDCSAYNNSDIGIYAGTGSTISDCSAYNNSDIGIYAGNGSTISGCTASSNTGDGIQTNYDNRIDSNHVTDNGCGIDVDGTGNLVIRNSASGNTTNYDIVAGNKDAQVLSAGSGFVSTNPWANFSF
jgi:parallel beta-helix repeat protein